MKIKDICATLLRQKALGDCVEKGQEMAIFSGKQADVVCCIVMLFTKLVRGTIIHGECRRLFRIHMFVAEVWKV